MAIGSTVIVVLAMVCIGSGSVIRDTEVEHEVDCDSQIFCQGELLHTVQMAKIYNDSKTFVDLKLKQSPEETLELFKTFMNASGGNPSREAVRKFVNETFAPRGSEFQEWQPKDWTPSPKFLENIRDPVYKQFGLELHSLWKILGREMIPDVTENPELYSIIPVPNPVIVPGGRFLEFYYWDSYWIIRGLLYSEMYETAKGMLENYLSIVNRYGYIPNGGRIYYLERTQPPLLAASIKAYVEATDDIQFMIDSLPLLEREFNFFLNNRMVSVLGHSLATYSHPSKGPRPESYSEDYHLAQEFETEEEREEFYAEIKAGAESGMDFSSRWFIHEDGTNNGTLSNIKCRSIVPVELNAILHWNAEILSEYFDLANQPDKAIEYKRRAQQFYDAIQAVLWNEEVGAWLDYDLINERPRNYFVPTNLSPLWTRAFNVTDSPQIAKKVLSYLAQTGVDRFPGGVPNTLKDAGEQWDFPNVWPPMQYILLEGLRELNDEAADRLSMRWTSRWTRSNYIAYNRTHAMFEKYDALTLGGTGGGGEYEVQVGFGWTNGVILELLAKYGDKLSSEVGY